MIENLQGDWALSAASARQIRGSYWALHFAAAVALSSILCRLNASTLAPCEPRWRAPVGYRSCLPTLDIGPLADDNLRLWPLDWSPFTALANAVPGLLFFCLR